MISGLVPDWLPWVSAITAPLILAIVFWTNIIRPWRARRTGRKRQNAADALSQMLSDAIHDLLNREVENEGGLAQFEQDYKKWCREVGDFLGERFTLADRIHFDRIGVVPETNFGSTYNARHNQLMTHLGIKFDRLRDIIRDNQFQG